VGGAEVVVVGCLGGLMVGWLVGWLIVGMVVEGGTCFGHRNWNRKKG
jgi:hypothetical protein